MYVRKFEAENMDEALKEIKREMGPDAIILKTVTNEGLKGAFKKNRIEITAAISEKNYARKARVDAVLDDDQKDSFYSNRSTSISNMIDHHSHSDESMFEVKEQQSNGGYGKMGLNRPVKTAKDLGKKLKSGLDDFLSKSEPKIETKTFTESPIQHEAQIIAQRTHAVEVNNQDNKRIDELERRIYELTENLVKVQQDEPKGIYHLRTILKTFDINESYIQKIIKKVIFEFSKEELDNSDLVFEYCLKRMGEEINTEMPMFSKVSSEPVITVLLSEVESGQTSMMQKIGALRSNLRLLKNNSLQDQRKGNFADRLLDLDVAEKESVAEIISECRKSIENGESVIVDYKSYNEDLNDTKKFINGLNRAFNKVEVLVTVSALHSEVYNRKVLSRYGELSSGMSITHLDLCLNYGALFNLALDYKDLPFKFYGTGNTVPDDIEAATAERILAGIFKL